MGFLFGRGTLLTHTTRTTCVKWKIINFDKVAKSECQGNLWRGRCSRRGSAKKIIVNFSLPRGTLRPERTLSKFRSSTFRYRGPKPSSSSPRLLISGHTAKEITNETEEARQDRTENERKIWTKMGCVKNLQRLIRIFVRD